MTDMDKKHSNWRLAKDIVVILIISAVTILYRWGGSEHGKRWLRPVGVGIGVEAVLWLLFGFHWSIILAGGASSLASTTYLKKKGESAKWFNWLLSGLLLSLCLLPWAVMTNHMTGFFVRTVFLAPAFMIWSQVIGNAIVEELGRGFLIVASLFLLLI